MKLVRIFLMIASLLSISASPPDGSVDGGVSMATTGTNGWYISDWSVFARSPVIANGKLLQPGQGITISAEGEQSIEFANLTGTDHATQFARIDRTPPTVEWISPLNSEVTAKSSGLSADIADGVSGICLVEFSTDHGRSWLEGWNAAGFGLEMPVKETTWTYHDGFRSFDNGAQVVILRAHDCAGNVSPGKILVVRMTGTRMEK